MGDNIKDFILFSDLTDTFGVGCGFFCLIIWLNLVTLNKIRAGGIKWIKTVLSISYYWPAILKTRLEGCMNCALEKACFSP